MKKSLFKTASFILVLTACYKDSDYDTTKLSASDTTVQIFTDQSSIAADSVSTSKVFVELPYNADSTKALVSFRTDLGIFVESGSQVYQIQAKQNVDSLKRIAIASLKSGTKTGFAHIQVSIYTQIKVLIDTFVNSYPDFMQISASTLAIKPSNTSTGEVAFSCRLFKFFGSASQLNVVAMKIYDSAYQNTYGHFRIYNNLSDIGGNTQFTFVLGDSTSNPITYLGTLHAIATVAKNSNDFLADTIDIHSSR